jgi:transcriptional regulator with XRE-family HTH domain
MKEEHKEDAKRIGRNILNLIIKNEIEQKDLAIALGVSEATVSSWVNGTRTPRMGTVNKICKYFSVPRSAILINSQLANEAPAVLTSEMFSAISKAVDKAIELKGVPAYGQPTEYYDSEAVRVVTDRLRTNPEYSALFKAASNLKPEDVEFVTKFIEKMSD